MKNHWLALVLGAVASGLPGQELYVQTLSFPGGQWAEAHGVSVNPAGEALLLGKVEGRPLAVLVSAQGEPQWTLVTDGTGSLERALPQEDGWVVAGAADFWPHDYGGAFVAKLDGAGNLLWQVGVTWGHEPVRLAPAPEGGFYVSFNRQDRSQLAGPAVARVSASGELEWVRVLSLPLARLNDVCSAPDGSLLVVGSVGEGESRYGFASLWDPQGQPRWTFRLPAGRTLDACSFGPQGRWLLVGTLEHRESPTDLWLATVDGEGQLVAQKKVVGDEGLWGYAAAAGSGWLVAAQQGLAYGEALMLQLPWDLSGLSALGYRGGRGVWPAGVAPMPDGTVLLAGTDATSVSRELFMVRSAGRREDFWECRGLTAAQLGLADAQEQLQSFSLAFSTEELYPVYWTVTPHGGELPERELRCTARSSPAADLALEGQASFDEELGAHSVVVSLRVKNQGEAPAFESQIEVLAGGGGVVQGLPIGFSCETSGTKNRARCQLGALEPGSEVTLEFVLRGSLLALRQGFALVSTSTAEQSLENNRLSFASILPAQPRKVLRPAPKNPGRP